MMKKRIRTNSLLALLAALAAVAIRPIVPEPVMEALPFVGCGNTTPAMDAAPFLDVPEPFRPFDAIGLTLDGSSAYALAVYDRHGRLVQHLTAFSAQDTGRQAVFWNGRTESGAAAHPGTYRVAVRINDGAYETPLLLAYE